MVDRITLSQPTYIRVDGQWSLLDSGSVIDVPDSQKFASSTVSAVSKNTGTLINNDHTGVTLRRK